MIHRTHVSCLGFGNQSIMTVQLDKHQFDRQHQETQAGQYQHNTLPIQRALNLLLVLTPHRSTSGSASIAR